MIHPRAIRILGALGALAFILFVFPRSALAMSGADLQARLSSLPLSDQVGSHNQPCGGVVRLDGARITPKWKITADKPIQLYSRQTLDLGGCVLEYTGDPARAAVEFASAAGHGYHVGGAVINGKIISSGKGLGVSPSMKGNLTHAKIENITIIARGPAIDLTGPAFCYGIAVNSIIIPNPAEKPIKIFGRLIALRDITINGKPTGYPTSPDAMIELDGQGECSNLWVESYDARQLFDDGTKNPDYMRPVTVVKAIGTWGFTGGWWEMPHGAPSLVSWGAGTIVEMFHPTFVGPNGVRAEQGTIRLSGCLDWDAWFQKSPEGKVFLDGAEK